VLAAAALLTAPPLLAHDLWIEPSTFTPAPGEPVALRLVLGDAAAVEAVPRSNGRIVRFLARGPEGEQAVPGLDGYDPAGFLRPTAPGWYTVLYESAPSLATLDPETVRSYLLEEGLVRPAVPAGVNAQQPVHELFRRSLKVLLRVGVPEGTVPGGAAVAELAGADAPRGLPLELVLEGVAPASSGAHDVSLRLLHERAPLSGAQVELRALGGDRERRSASARTDGEGRVRLELAPGRWVATTVHLDGAHPALADWASVWTSLAFELP
jgi:hypothetical protein